MTGYPKWFTANLITGTVFVMSLSGLLMIPTALELRLDTEVFFRLTGASRIITTALHVIAGLISFLILGALATIHVRQGWRRKQKIFTGTALICFLLILGISGVALLYLAHPMLTILSSVSHSIAGILVLCFYLIHVWIQKKLASKT